RRAVVDLPQPVSPTMPSVVPASTVNETLSTAETYAFEYSPVRTENLFRSPSTRSSTGDGVCVAGAGVAPPEAFLQPVPDGVAASAVHSHRILLTLASAISNDLFGDASGPLSRGERELGRPCHAQRGSLHMH